MKTTLILSNIIIFVLLHNSISKHLKYTFWTRVFHIHEHFFLYLKSRIFWFSIKLRKITITLKKFLTGLKYWITSTCLFETTMRRATLCNPSSSPWSSSTVVDDHRCSVSASSSWTAVIAATVISRSNDFGTRLYFSSSTRRGVTLTVARSRNEQNKEETTPSKTTEMTCNARNSDTKQIIFACNDLVLRCIIIISCFSESRTGETSWRLDALHLLYRHYLLRLVRILCALKNLIIMYIYA